MICREKSFELVFTIRVGRGGFSSRYELRSVLNPERQPDGGDSFFIGILRDRLVLVVEH